jgi:putative nucleotidyltransferase with HDIG domain
MAALERRLDELPLLPTVVTEVLSLDPDAEDYFDRLLNLAERDPPFAVRVLRCANSAASAPATPVVSLQTAIMRLGSRRCAELVIALAVIRVFVPRTDAQRFLWVHSLQVALLARGLCQRAPTPGCNAEQAYLCGLLHDIGRFVQFEGAPADLSRIDDTHWSSPVELVSAEHESVGYDHALLGSNACRKWALPASIAEVVRRHHEALPDLGTGDRLVRVVQWADRLSMALILDRELHQASDGDLPAALVAREALFGKPPGNDTPQHWSLWVPELRAEATRLAAQLQLTA